MLLGCNGLVPRRILSTVVPWLNRRFRDERQAPGCRAGVAVRQAKPVQELPGPDLSLKRSDGTSLEGPRRGRRVRSGLSGCLCATDRLSSSGSWQ